MPTFTEENPVGERTTIFKVERDGGICVVITTRRYDAASEMSGTSRL
jgi:hypothetical protein